jgi:bud emergence protein 1
VFAISPFQHSIRTSFRFLYFDMKSLRKSLNSNKDSIRQHISTPLPLPAVSKPPASVLPPQKVIRALASYRPQAPQELPFQKGDFFYVLRDVDQHGAWYEAHNPVTGARGLVPRSLFEEFGKNLNALALLLVQSRIFYSPAADLYFSFRTSQVGGKPAIAIRTSTTDTKPLKTQAFYAVVLHDFAAERTDELDAKQGDAISIVAQSNREWFVAKPIGKLGRPGLIPVTFVEMRDPATNQPILDVEGLMDRGDLPGVEDWKRAMLSYKQNSISLGVLEDPPNRVPNSPYRSIVPPPMPSRVELYPQLPPQQEARSPARALSPEHLPEGVLLLANVVSYHFEMEEFWFRVDADFQPFPPPGSNVLPSAKHLVLFRVYNDFYDFQVAMLNTFPREAGRLPPHPRVLPYMPGPADPVDTEVTSTRRVELDDYLKKLCQLKGSGSRYILEHEVTRTFLALKPGDVGVASEPKVKEMEALYGPIYGGSSKAYKDPSATRHDYANEIKAFSQMKISDREEAAKYEGFDYDNNGYAPSPLGYDPEPHPYNLQRPRGDSLSLRQGSLAQNHQRSGSQTSFNQDYYGSNSRSNSPLPGSNNHAPRSYSPNGGRSTFSLDPPRTSNDYARRQDDEVSTPSSLRSRSHSVSTTSNVNNPPISPANPQTAFIKIKIFDRVADDLIAIRVHPRVTHAELMDKVQARLGGEVVLLRYRDSLNRNFINLQGDEDLRAWLAGTDKYVLYAD